MKDFEFDVFISHASQDKDEVARPLSEALHQRGCRVWFDEMTLKIGDSLRRKIDEGLERSRFGIVVLSPSFFERQWTNYELDGLLAREMADAVKVILPIWHNVEASQVRSFSGPLAMRVGGSTNKGIVSLASELIEIIRPNQTDQSGSNVHDELTLCKQAILSRTLETGKLFVIDKGGSDRFVQLGGYAFRDTEKQRKLFLFALEQLMHAGLMEHVSGILYELTYPGIQAGERMNAVHNPERLGL